MAVLLGGTQRPRRHTDSSLPRLSPRKPKYNVSPSTSSSIPSKYQVFFKKNEEKKGFASQAPRFTPNEVSIYNDNPGPGEYSSAKESIETKTLSCSTRGTSGFASKVHQLEQIKWRRVGSGLRAILSLRGEVVIHSVTQERFLRALLIYAQQSRRFLRGRLSNIGPGYYNPEQLPGKVDFSKGVNSFFQKKIAQETKDNPSSVPAPNTYDVSSKEVSDVMPSSQFRSKTKREGIQTKNKDGPAPCHYNVKDDFLKTSAPSHRDVFMSKTKQGAYLYNKEKVPGPGKYSPYKSHIKKTKKLNNHKHILCLSAPAIPLPPLPPPPGPGQYEIVDYCGPKETACGDSVFKSTTSRWISKMADSPSSDIPGPGSYYPKLPPKQSYLYNIRGQWI